MSAADSEQSVISLSNRVFVHQTATAVYASPAADAEVVVRLHEGDPLDILQQSDTAAGWMPVQTISGHSGFIKANTKIATREQLLTEREKIRRGYGLGCGKMVMGGAIFLFGCVSLAYFLLYMGKRDGPFIIYYGAIGVGAGEFLWGLEQVSNVRHVLKKFDALWREAI